MIPEIGFAGLSAMSEADLLQLPPVSGKLIFSEISDKGSMKHLLGLKLWNLFKYAELAKAVRQNGKLFIDFLDLFRVGNIDDDLKKLPEIRFIRESDENYSKDAWHMCEPAMKRNEIVLNDLPGQLYTTESNDKTPDNCKCILGVGEEGGGSICRWTRNEDFQYGISRFLEKYGRETVFITLDGAGNYWKK